MENNPTRHRPHSAGRNHPAGHSVSAKVNNGKTNQAKGDNSLANFLIQSDVKPLVFTGKCVKFFGLGAVAAFLLGAASVYGYAMFRPLPYVAHAPAAAQPNVNPVAIPNPSQDQAKTRWVHGVVTNNDKRITSEIEIGVLQSPIRGPFPNGSYELKVPEADSYHVTVWEPGHRNFKLVELRPDAAGNLPSIDYSPVTGKLARAERLQSNGPANRFARSERGRSRTTDVAPTRDKVTAVGLNHSENRSQP